MADTSRGSFMEPCSDCGEIGSFIRHTGSLVPEGEVGYFCPFCWEQRLTAGDRGKLPEPLGIKPPGIPKEFANKALTVMTRTGSVYKLGVPNERGERSIFCETRNVGFDTCKVLSLSIGKDLWIRSSDISNPVPCFWSTTQVVSIV